MTLRTGILAVAVAVMACGGEPTDPPGPTSGVVVAALGTPNDRDGGVVVRIIGEHSLMKAAGAYRLATGTSGATTRAVVSGTIVDGDLLEFTIPDVSKLATYVVVVEQAAARDTYALLDPSGYNVTLRLK